MCFHRVWFWLEVLPADGLLNISQLYLVYVLPEDQRCILAPHWSLVCKPPTTCPGLFCQYLVVSGKISEQQWWARFSWFWFQLWQQWSGWAEALWSSSWEEPDRRALRWSRLLEMKEWMSSSKSSLDVRSLILHPRPLHCKPGSVDCT